MGGKRKSHLAEILIVMMLAGSIWQYHETGKVTWITEAFYWIDSRVKEFTDDLPELTYQPTATIDHDLFGIVVKVIDGDTITIQDNSSKMHKVRLHGIDAPETNQTYGRVATQTLTKLVGRKQVQIDIKDTDRYGRAVGVVYIEGTNVNLEMVCTGHAWWYQRYAKNNTELQGCERRARNQKLGLWNNTKPVPPWDYRRQ